jgi:hypothetical protein
MPTLRKRAVAVAENPPPSAAAPGEMPVAFSSGTKLDLL